MDEAELSAAKVFRDYQRAAFEVLHEMDKPDIIVSVLIRHYRHDCARQGGRSVGLELREHYVLSPALIAFTDGQVRETERSDLDFAQEVLDDLDEAGMCHLSIVRAIIPAGRFGWIFTEGRCPACGVTARSGTGRLVDPETRPPAARSVVSGITGHEDLRDRRSG